MNTSDIEKESIILTIGNYVVASPRDRRIKYFAFLSISFFIALTLPVYFQQPSRIIGFAASLPGYLFIFIAWWAIVGFPDGQGGFTHSPRKAGWVTIIGVVAALIVVTEIIVWMIFV